MQCSLEVNLFFCTYDNMYVVTRHNNAPLLLQNTRLNHHYVILNNKILCCSKQPYCNHHHQSFIFIYSIKRHVVIDAFHMIKSIGNNNPIHHEHQYFSVLICVWVYFQIECSRIILLMQSIAI